MGAPRAQGPAALPVILGLESADSASLANIIAPLLPFPSLLPI